MNPAMRMRGVGDYDRVANWSWMRNPPPYDFLNRTGVKPAPNFYAPAKTMGLGCGGSCHCGGKCSQGMGLFDSLNPTTWGLGEWAIAGVAVFALVKVLGAGMTRRKSRKLMRRAKWGT